MAHKLPVSPTCSLFVWQGSTEYHTIKTKPKHHLGMIWLELLQCLARGILKRDTHSILNAENLTVLASARTVEVSEIKLNQRLIVQ